MSSVHCIVVWEWQCNGQWLPHSPGVARTLERAHAKKLTRVVLADAEPALRGHSVNLRTLTQSSDSPDGGTSECLVRRACYSVQSAGGKGVGWGWARVGAPPHRAELHYEPLPMEIQCRLEEAWSLGSECVQWEGWTVQVSRMTARHAGGALRLVRRAPQPPYPLARSAAPPPPPTAHPPPLPPTDQAALEVRRCRIPQQHTGSSVHSIQSAHSAHSAHSAQSAHSGTSARTATTQRSDSPKDRKPNLARQILHNLNIFSHSNKPPPPHAHTDSAHTSECTSGDELTHTDTESGSTRGRRHSVDTVSTYLSHESKESLQQASVGELLNCSAGSDDVFDPPPPLPLAPPLPAPPTSDTPPDDDQEGTIVGIDSASMSVCVHVRAVRCVQWGALCPACLRALDAGPPAVALVPCQHLLHLHCLNRHLQRLHQQQEPLYIECLVCGRVYGSPPAVPAAAPPPAPPPLAAGEQPAGSMAWSLQPATLPGTRRGTPSILVTYNFQSGRQGPRHPVPGAPYYAVGFPRHTLLPDTPLGRQVLSALRRLWEARLLFTVSASLTTGREHVVTWRVPPPPAERDHYRAPHSPDLLLARALQRLHDVMPLCDVAHE